MYISFMWFALPKCMHYLNSSLTNYSQHQTKQNTVWNLNIYLIFTSAQTWQRTTLAIILHLTSSCLQLIIFSFPHLLYPISQQKTYIHRCSSRFRQDPRQEQQSFIQDPNQTMNTLTPPTTKHNMQPKSNTTHSPTQPLIGIAISLTAKPENRSSLFYNYVQTIYQI